jgi:hypothetical protein
MTDITLNRPAAGAEIALPQKLIRTETLEPVTAFLSVNVKDDARLVDSVYDPEVTRDVSVNVAAADADMDTDLTSAAIMARSFRDGNTDTDTDLTQAAVLVRSQNGIRQSNDDSINTDTDADLTQAAIMARSFRDGDTDTDTDLTQAAALVRSQNETRQSNNDIIDGDTGDDYLYGGDHLNAGNYGSIIDNSGNVSGSEPLVLELDEDMGELDAILNHVTLDGLKQVCNDMANDVYLNLTNATQVELAGKGLTATATQTVVNDVTYQEYTYTEDHQDFVLYISGAV